MSDAGPPQGAKAPAGGSEDTRVPSVGVLVVLDTNIVLDTFVFSDAAAVPLRAGLEDGSLQWIATAGMRTELARVLDYPQIVPRLAFYGLTAADVLAAFDRHARLVAASPKARFTCTDPDDQPFIDLAVAHQCVLLSKDRAVLRLKKRLLGLGVQLESDFGRVVTGLPASAGLPSISLCGADPLNGRGSARTAPG